MRRLKAASAHFFLSLIVFLAVITIVIFLWYPEPHFKVSGGWQGLKIAAMIDLVLGPLLTLIIFNTQKSKAKLMGDLSVIAILQFGALAYGVTTIFQQRPVAVVFWENSFYSIPASRIPASRFNKSDWQNAIQKGLPFIYAEKPKTADGLKQLLANIQEHKLAPHHQIDLYKPLKPYFTSLLPYQTDIGEVIKKNVRMKSEIEQFIASTKTTIEDYVYFPLYSKYQNSILMFDYDGNLENIVIVPLK